jgi:hypothetical protein
LSFVVMIAVNLSDLHRCELELATSFEGRSAQKTSNVGYTHNGIRVIVIQSKNKRGRSSGYDSDAIPDLDCWNSTTVGPCASSRADSNIALASGKKITAERYNVSWISVDIYA